MIHVGDGRHVEVVEGGLRPPLYVHPQTGVPKTGRLRSPSKFKAIGMCSRRAFHDVPGWREWRSRCHAEIQATQPPEKIGKAKGHIDGFRAPQVKAIREACVNMVMNDEEISALIASIKETDPIAAFAMREMIILAAAPGATKDRVTLLKTILDFTKSKPAVKQEVNVAQQDTWAMLLDEARDKNNENEPK